MKSSCLKYLLPMLLFAMAGATRAQLVNGNFETGDLTGWTLFNTVGSGTPYGTEQGGTAVAQAVPFDTAGLRTARNLKWVKPPALLAAEAWDRGPAFINMCRWLRAS
jgi:hypothetical protein